MICPCCGKPKRPKEIPQGLGTALKPAMELICLARKPIVGTVAKNVSVYGTGAINVDACRVEAPDADLGAVQNCRTGQSGHTVTLNIPGHTQPTYNRNGRWPANVIHDGSEEVVGAFPETQSGEFLPHHRATGASRIGTFDIRDRSGEVHPTYGDNGSAARFFYTAKADADDRIGSKHPTVKPIDLMQYLIRLVTPKGGLVLDCFAGTGGTGEAAWREGMRAILIEREAQYFADIERRIRLLSAGPEERARESIKASGKVLTDAGPLFGGVA